mmetsp:Transcript_8644/g.18295  ORF Transcript_8644/g.18295 Transcript_8644/m.18295 type:complete len:544 (-) Transcript_8644:152-1783(-)
MLAAALRKLIAGGGSAEWCPEEEVAVARLGSTYEDLVIEGGRVHTGSEVGFSNCAAFLDAVDHAGRIMRLEPASREYRAEFTVNYKALFPTEQRSYRVDVLEASIEQNAVIWVNGDKFEFSAEAMRRAQALQSTWADLGTFLEHWNPALGAPRATTAKAEFAGILVALDLAWASFEHKYIAELITIEEKARRLIVQAIEHDQRLRRLEASATEEALQRLPEYREAQKCLVASIAHLNSCANFKRKGRDDLGVEVLHDATRTLRRCDIAGAGGSCPEALGAAHVIASDVLDSFVAVREYLREVQVCLERVDPHLCNNSGLVARLVDWEESWEVGSRYGSELLIAAVCGVVTEIHAAQRLAPALASMCEDCDVELFMVLPRIVWLCFLAEPTRHAELLKALLPHRFSASTEDNPQTGAEPPRPWDNEIEAFIEMFRRGRAAVASAHGGPAAGQAAREALVRRVVAGGADGGAGGQCSPAAAAAAVAAGSALEEAMRELERWSIELQRHCPEDWNHFAAMLVRCLAACGAAGCSGNEGKRTSPFNV